MGNLLDNLKSLLRKDERLVSEGELLKNKVIELALKLDKELIEILLSDKQMKEVFFTEVGKATIFDKDKFIRFVSSKDFLPDSYTAFKQKIGLIDEYGRYFSQIPTNEVVLAWPYKDCVLEGGMTKEDQKRDEIFWNETLAPDEISRLLDPKVFINAKRIDAKGEHKFDGFRTDEKGDIKDNLIIKGNNLLALHSLKKRFAGKVKLIYIDPPYNREADTFYNDSFKHSSWLTFMKNRLEIARDLLKDDGVIFVQCDDTEQAYLKVLMDEVFERENFINIITIKSKVGAGVSGGGESKKIKKNTEFLILFCKNKRYFSYNPIYKKISIREYIEKHKEDNIGFYYTRILIDTGKKKFKEEIDGLRIYEYINPKFNTVQNIINKENLSLNEVYARYFNKIFMVTNAQTSILDKVNKIVPEKNKLVSYEYIPATGKNKNQKIERFIWNKTLVVWFSDSAILEDKKVSKLEEIGTLWSDISWGRLDLEGGIKLKSGKKPEALIKRIIELVSNKEEDIILDFFLGSGTTAAFSHKIGRQYIGIEQLDYGENSAVVRLKNVINSDQSGISKSVGWKGGGDFVYLELMKWNEKFSDEIKKAKSGKELQKLWETMKERAFLSYKVDIKAVDENAKDFADLSVGDQKRFLRECLDNNHLYVNYSEIGDEEYGVSEEDKKLNREFYETKH